MGTIPDATATLLPPAAILDKREEEGTITEFHVTGFGPFHNIPVNPTQSIVESLAAHLSDNPLTPTAVVASSTVLKVSAETTSTQIESMYKALDRPTHPALLTRSRADRRVVFIHFGVNARVSNFQLEIQGRNEATFSCPDENGWTPIKRPINLDNPDLTAVCRTKLRLDELVTQLSKQGFPVEISTDAGRFVCNWLYYNSLLLAEKTAACALFVHVPPASVIPIEEQLQFVAALLDCIAKTR